MVIIQELERPLGASMSTWEFREIPGLVLTAGPHNIPLFQYSDGQPGPGWKFDNWGSKRLAGRLMSHLESKNFATRNDAMEAFDLALFNVGYASKK